VAVLKRELACYGNHYESRRLDDEVAVDNRSLEDAVTRVEPLKREILPKVNLEPYGLIESPKGSGHSSKTGASAFGRPQQCVQQLGVVRRRMSPKIDQDHSRFRDIVRGKIGQNLGRYISQGKKLRRKGKNLASIPILPLDIPRFTFGDDQEGGIRKGPTSIENKGETRKAKGRYPPLQPAFGTAPMGRPKTPFPSPYT